MIFCIGETHLFNSFVYLKHPYYNIQSLLYLSQKSYFKPLPNDWHVYTKQWCDAWWNFTLVQLYIQIALKIWANNATLVWIVFFFTRDCVFIGITMELSLNDASIIFLLAPPCHILILFGTICVSSWLFKVFESAPKNEPI